MRDQYVGDIGDFAKYGLLRYLTGIMPADRDPCLSLGVIWYARPDLGTDYLNDQETFQNCDPELFNSLRAIVNTRTLAKIEGLGILGKATKYWRCSVPSEKPKRIAWLNGALKRVSGCDVVFLDPDNGLRLDKSVSSETKISTEHAYLDEVIAIERNAEAVVLYHSFDHNTSHCKQIEEKIEQLESEFCNGQGVFAVRWNRLPTRVFFIICKEDKYSLLQQRLQEMVGTWGKGRFKNNHFTLCK